MRTGGALGSENVGTSNHKSSEILDRQKSKVSLATLINQGLVGPKAMMKIAANGYAVNIRQLPRFSDGGTERSMPRMLLDLCPLNQDAV